VALAALAVVATAVWVAIAIGNPFPPRTILMATGPEGSAYHEFGNRYRQILKSRGFELRLVPSHGGVENLALLRDPGSGVSVGFVEGGVTRPEESPDLVSLGTVSLEPLWVFTRGGREGAVAEKLAGRRISIEPEGSSTRVMARLMFKLNNVDERSLRLLGLTPQESAEALVKGEIDGAMMLTSWHSPTVRRLLTAEGIRLEAHPRADAYVALFPTFSKVVLPMGVADLGRNIPTADVPLVAVQGRLVVRQDLHPAVQYALLEAASDIHGGPDVFNRAGRYPSAEALDLPLSRQAREFYKSGLPFVYRYLPSWLAGVAERLLILLIPLFTIVFPIAHFVPTLYASFIQNRIFRLYGELKFIESEIGASGPGAVGDEVVSALADLGRRADGLHVPLAYAQRLFILKSHIAMAQAEVEKKRRAAAPPAAS
jgi:TRAP-type uncharacterized transport system substrate-binding protein